MDRREFLGVVAAAAAAGMALPRSDARAAQDADAVYDAPPYGTVSPLHFTDCHAYGRRCPKRRSRPAASRSGILSHGICAHAGPFPRRA